MASVAYERSTKWNRGLKASLFFLFTVALVVIHIGVYQYEDDFKELGLRWFKQDLGIQLYSAGVISVLFVLAFCIVSAIPQIRYDPEAHNLIYYLGFMSTLASLMISSWALTRGGLAGANSGVEVVAQNGLALLATFCGVLCRNMLRYLFPPQTESLVARWEELRRTVVAVDAGLQALTVRVQSFQGSFQQATQAIDQGAPRWEQVTAVTQSMDEAFRASSTTLQNLNASLGQGADANQQLARTIAESARNIRGLGAEVQRLQETVEQSTQVPQDVRPRQQPPLLRASR